MNLRNRITVLAATLVSCAGMVTLATGANAAEPTADSTAGVSARVTAAAAASSYHTIKNLAYNQCVDAPGGVLNVRLQLANCNGSSTQNWAFVSTGSADTYYLVNQASAYCAEVNNGTSVPGEAVDEYLCDGLASEQWVETAVTVDQRAGAKFRHVGTNLCLDTVSSFNSQLMQWSCDDAHPAAAQVWIVS
ncbi:RICIN domain-containing protein [Streptomyces sp. W16]|uniref:RICIN domain-containing protein n=1 Tax=Streptomyces sp. W16 TaxID=3076631 RepID=UPI00295BE730|nr:RICIN domain-containing protein [Streptomyces sp. W16]MDV9178367.1 RICIN domain-containing protein [Streptomyces sp. W16]